MGSPAQYRHVQRLQHRIGGLPALHRPTHHAAGIEINHDGQIDKALQGPEWSRKRMIVTSTPAEMRCTAVAWRKACGVTCLAHSVGMVSAAVLT